MKILMTMVLFALFGIVPTYAQAPAPTPTLSLYDSVLVSHLSPIFDARFEKIAICESKNDPLAKNPNSSAKGRFQFLDSTWKRYGMELWGWRWIDKNPLDYQDNTELAWYAYDKYGTGDWLASKDCWAK